MQKHHRLQLQIEQLKSMESDPIDFTILVDPTKAANQFGLPTNQIDFLQSQILKGTGKVE